MRKLYTFLVLILLLGTSLSVSAVTKRVLFIGNSYTDVNNLPQLIANMASSSGDNLVFSTSIPGGQTFQGHSAAPATLSLIAQGGWDYVVLQEQSQRPSFPPAQVATEVYPYAKKLDSLVHAASPCAKTIFYMTWGRKNGDAGNCAAWPPVCTYLGMDSLLQERYTIMADDNDAWLSPVAKVWRRLRNQNPGINLYDADESHPSMAGSFAAACSFYAVIFGKNPEHSTFSAGLSSADAATIKTAAKIVVYDSLQYWRKPGPVPAFTSTVTGMSAQMTNTSQMATSYYWTFGDGQTSTLTAPTHVYTANGNYNVTLAAIKPAAGSCIDTVRLTKRVAIGTTAVGQPIMDEEIVCYPNPAGDRLFVRGLKGSEALEVTDMAGRKAAVYYKMEGTKAVMATAELATGLYLLQVSRDGTLVRTLRFSKK